jgi:hypothetical protein
MFTYNQLKTKVLFLNLLISGLSLAWEGNGFFSRWMEGGMKRIGIITKIVLLKMVALIGAIIVAVGGEIGADFFRQYGTFDETCQGYYDDEGCGRF